MARLAASTRPVAGGCSRSRSAVGGREHAPALAVAGAVVLHAWIGSATADWVKRSDRATHLEERDDPPRAQTSGEASACARSVDSQRQLAVCSPTPAGLRSLASVMKEDEGVARKFEAAWNVFASTCAQFIAPEPTYQAWFAHCLISQFGIDRVAREPMIKKAAFADSDWKRKVMGDHVRLDVVVMSQPGVHLPHYASSIDRAADGTGLERLGNMAVISELKVTATQGGGQSHTEVARDAYKLSMLLDELERAAPGTPLPFWPTSVSSITTPASGTTSQPSRLTSTDCRIIRTFVCSSRTR